MSDYRIDKFDKSGKTTGPPYIVQCEDDDGALMLARCSPTIKPERFGKARGVLPAFQQLGAGPHKPGMNEAAEIAGRQR